MSAETGQTKTGQCCEINWRDVWGEHFRTNRSTSAIVKTLSAIFRDRVDKATIAFESATRREQVLVRMVADQRPKRLVEGNNADLELLLSKCFSKVSLNHIRDDSRHRLVEVGIESEKRTNAFGKADDPLAIEHQRQDII